MQARKPQSKTLRLCKSISPYSLSLSNTVNFGMRAFTVGTAIAALLASTITPVEGRSRASFRPKLASLPKLPSLKTNKPLKAPFHPVVLRAAVTKAPVPCFENFQDGKAVVLQLDPDFTIGSSSTFVDAADHSFLIADVDQQSGHTYYEFDCSTGGTQVTTDLCKILNENRMKGACCKDPAGAVSVPGIQETTVGSTIYSTSTIESGTASGSINFQCNDNTGITFDAKIEVASGASTTYTPEWCTEGSDTCDPPYVTPSSGGSISSGTVGGGGGGLGGGGGGGTVSLNRRRRRRLIQASAEQS